MTSENNQRQWGYSVNNRRREYVHNLLEQGVEIDVPKRKELAKEFNCSTQTIYTDIVYYRASSDEKALKYILSRKFNQLRIRAKKHGVVDTLTFDELEELVHQSEGICYYCLEYVGKQYLSFDHIMPMSQGGENSRGNLVASCNGCNIKKGARDAATQRTGKGHYLPRSYIEVLKEIGGGKMWEGIRILVEQEINRRNKKGV